MVNIARRSQNRSATPIHSAVPDGAKVPGRSEDPGISVLPWIGSHTVMSGPELVRLLSMVYSCCVSPPFPRFFSVSFHFTFGSNAISWGLWSSEGVVPLSLWSFFTFTSSEVMFSTLYVIVFIYIFMSPLNVNALEDNICNWILCL